MGYHSEVVRRARQRLESAKADKESLYRERLQTVYTQLPRVREIDIALRKSMVLLPTDSRPALSLTLPRRWLRWNRH